MVQALSDIGNYSQKAGAWLAVTDFSLGRGVETPLGQGAVDWPALLGALEQKSYGGYFTVHQENAADPMMACEASFGYLQEMFG